MIYSSGIQSFSELRHYGCKYVDKTNYLYNLINSGKYFYLCRPRRFGKSLTLSTLEYIFKGKKELFNGLYIENKWNWQQEFAIIRIDFTLIGEKDSGLKIALIKKLKDIATDYKIEIFDSMLNLFRVIYSLKRRTVAAITKNLITLFFICCLVVSATPFAQK